MDILLLGNACLSASLNAQVHAKVLCGEQHVVAWRLEDPSSSSPKLKLHAGPQLWSQAVKACALYKHHDTVCQIQMRFCSDECKVRLMGVHGYAFCLTWLIWSVCIGRQGLARPHYGS